MDLRDKLQNNPVVWLLSTLFIGFMAGLGTYEGILRIAQLEVISSAKLEDLREASARIEAPRGSETTPPGGNGGGGGDPQEPPEETPANPPVRPLFQKLSVFEVKASSYRRAALDFPPRNAINGIIRPQYNRSWQSDRADAVGAWLELHLPERRQVGRIRVFMVIEDSNRGGQIRDARLTFPDGTTQEVRFPFAEGWQEIELKPVETEVVRLEVLSIYPGNNKIDNLEVAEVELYGA